MLEECQTVTELFDISILFCKWYTCQTMSEECQTVTELFWYINIYSVYVKQCQTMSNNVRKVSDSYITILIHQYLFCIC